MRSGRGCWRICLGGPAPDRRWRGRGERAVVCGKDAIAPVQRVDQPLLESESQLLGHVPVDIVDPTARDAVHPDAKRQQRTILAVPPRVRANAVHISCGGKVQVKAGVILSAGAVCLIV